MVVTGLETFRNTRLRVALSHKTRQRHRRHEPHPAASLAYGDGPTPKGAALRTPAETMIHYEQAATSHDQAATMALIADDAVYWFSDATTHVGKPAVEQAIRSNFNAIEMETYAIDELTWIAQSTDVAVCTYAFSWTGIVQGQETGGSGRGTNVLRQGEDKWLILHEHLSKGTAR